MNNKLILDLTVRLTQALDQNYDVVNMDTVLAVISALEGATITKEQLETTRLAKHINQLRKRNKNNILAIRAKNLVKKWREMVGITSQAQSEVTSSVTQQAQPTQQAPKPPLSSSSQPASPYTTHLLGENFDNSLSSIGGGVEYSRTATGGVSNTGSANFTFSKRLTGEGSEIISSRSNGALNDTQTRLIKSSNRSIINNNSSPSPPGNVIKVKHPTSFKNLITGFNANTVPKQTNPSPLSPISKITPASSEREGTNSKAAYVIDNDDHQSQPSTTPVAKTRVSSPRTHKSTKRKERDSPIVMAFTENSNSPLGFENNPNESGQGSQPAPINNVNQIVTSTIDLQDSNSSSNFVNSLCESTENNLGNSGRVGLTDNSNKRIRKDKKRSDERVDLVTESEHFQPTIDESSRIAFPISGIQEYLSLSNSSMSIFPTQQTAGFDGAERYPTNAGSNDDNQPVTTSIERNTEVLDGDLTFAGKFKQSNSSSGIEVGSNSNYFSNGAENTSVTSTEFPCGNMKAAINNCRDSVSVGGLASTSTFLSFSRNSNESTSNSRTSQLDLIDVVNQDSQSMITVDDLRQQQSSNDKNKTQSDIESAQETQNAKFIKENSNTSKPSLKDQGKSSTIQKSLNASSKPPTPTSAPNVPVSSTLTSPPPEQKIPKKRGRKKGSKGVDSVLAQSAGLSTQFLMGPALGSTKKVKTTMELLADIQNRKLGSATSSPTLMNWFGTSRPASSCSEPSLHSPRTSDACSTNATISTAARSTPEKNMSNNSVAPDELYESESDSNTSEPSHDSVKVPTENTVVKNSQLKSISENMDGAGASLPLSTIEDQIKELMSLLPPVDLEKIDWEACEDVPCTCTLREIQPEVDAEHVSSTEINENGLDLLENMEDIKNKGNDARQDDDEPIISVSIIPPVPQKTSQAKLWYPMAVHSQSAPVSAVTSPVVSSTNQKPMKSIFDLDFDDDNDPLHTFVEAANKNKKSTESYENGKIKSEGELTKHTTTETDDPSETIKQQQTEQAVSQPELTQLSPLVQQTSQQQPPAVQVQNSDSIMPLHVNFPTYQAVEDPDCQARQRYEVQTNQITQFHINAFHNCFIPNVNGNWDHSVPRGIDNQNQLENDSLYANVVPKYGCLVVERIPKDLSHVKFTKDFKPNNTKKSDKPHQPFLGVANIHRRQHFRLHHQQRRKRKSALRKRNKAKILLVKPENEQETKNEISKIDSSPAVTIDETVVTNIPEKNASSPHLMDVDAERKENALEEKEPPLETVPDISTSTTFDGDLHNNLDDLYQQQAVPNHKNINNVINPLFIGKSDLIIDVTNEAQDNSENNTKINTTDTKKKTLNGNVHHLMNNNSIVHCPDENKSDVSGSTRVIHNNNHNLLVSGMDEDGIIASRRSSSCSNSSLKQNQNSINMKLRRHRLEQQELEKQRQYHRKRKHLATLNDVFDFDTDEAVEQPKVPPLIKRIKIVNGEYAPSRRLTDSITDSSCLDDDGDSDCYHMHLENDIITEEESEEECDERGIRETNEDVEYKELFGGYDEEDGDDEEDADEDYGDFHEVVTRDVTSSTTGNNHIVLTIKKTPSKTNSPSSSSMSPAPIQNANTKLSSISPTIQSTVDALLMEDNAIELTACHTDSAFQEEDKLKIEKFLELNAVDTVDLIGKTNFFLPETSDVSIYSFQVKKNGDNDHGDDENDRNNRDHRSDENDRPEETNRSNRNEDAEKKKEEEENVPILEIPAEKKEFKEITKAELSESIQLTKKQLRRQELKRRLRLGIEEARKLHRQLFFPYELHPSIGTKILEMNSCTSGCTDPSDDETDSSDSNSDTSTTTSSSGLDGMKSGITVKIHRKRKLPPKRKRAGGGGGGGGPPSSSSSSSDSSSSSSNSSMTWTTTDSSSSSSDDDDSKPLDAVVVKKEEKKEEEESSKSDNQDKEGEKELPVENNFYLRSFNHIYISTEERRRQQLQQHTLDYHRTGILNSGYIALTGDTSISSIPPLVASGHSGVYINYFNNNSNINTYSNNNNGIVSNDRPSTYNTNTKNNEQEPSIVNQSTAEPSTVEPSTAEPSIAEPSTVTTPIKDNSVENTSTTDTSSVITSSAESSIVESSTVTMPLVEESVEQSPLEEKTNNDNNYRINLDNSTVSNNNINNSSSIQVGENTEQDLVAQEEYRTGMRKVDEDVDDEDGNNCARTQQFKEWHEVLQLRSYNDELLTVLPYVVIE